MEPTGDGLDGAAYRDLLEAAVNGAEAEKRVAAAVNAAKDAGYTSKSSAPHRGRALRPPNSATASKLSGAPNRVRTRAMRAADPDEASQRPLLRRIDAGACECHMG